MFYAEKLLSLPKKTKHGANYYHWTPQNRPGTMGKTSGTGVVRKVDNTIHRINHYPVESVVCSVHSKAIYPVDSVNEPSNNRGLYYIGCYQI